MIKININKYKNTSIKINSLINFLKFHLDYHMHLECIRSNSIFKIF